jgi:hypothetical protein
MLKKILMTYKNIVLAFLILLSTGLTAQVWVESPLNSNATLIQKSNELKSHSMYRSGGSITDTLTLGVKGFLDDFSNAGPYPDTARWLNNFVFVNRDMPIAPPTLGVATFDGVNADGYPYDFLASTSSTGKADTLTSKPIDLYFPGDTSIYFSFYYQAQGRGNFPDPSDSLILEFKTPVTGAWHHVWAQKGGTSVITDSAWEQVMIHINDPAYLQNGFQFRFSNWATLSGNGDHWHIDYVYLNQNRPASDTIFEDDAFVYNSPSLIKTYNAMPWRQYDSTLYKKQRYTTYIRNNDNTLHSGGFGYKIFDEFGLQVNTTYTGGGLDFYPFSSVGYIDGVNDSACAFPKLNYVIPSPLSGKTSYTFEAFLDSSPNDTLPSDTIRHKQVFDNYYAYDDGTAEISFGLAGILHAQIAEKFVLNVADTLRCIDIYFNPQWTNASAYTFTFRVWLSSGGPGPGPVIYINPTVDTPKYNPTGHDKFTRYYLDAPIYLPASVPFFIGFDQNTTQPINIGVDKNTNTQSNLFYNTSGSWMNPPFTGSLMMRPVLGSDAEIVGVSDNGSITSKNERFIVYPNPADDKLYIRCSSGSDEQIGYSIMDISGRIILENNIRPSHPIDLSELSNGVYFIRLSTDTSVSAHKFIISK